MIRCARPRGARFLAFLFALACSACDEAPAPDGECMVGCPMSSGYPCPCTAGDTCDDGSTCGGVDLDHDVGVCSIPCASHADCALDWNCTGKGRCVLELDGTSEKHCALTCRSDDDCPLYMTCHDEDGLKLCYPTAAD